jgi:glycosyltransferase involved in cell wall biosynthesis
LKILQISSAASFGGGERYVVDLTNNLVARGHDLYAAVRPQSPLPRHLNLPSQKILTLPLRNALDVQSAHELDRFVRRQHIEVIHAHMARDYSLAAYAARRNRATKFIATRHVLFELSRFHRHTLARAFRVIAVSGAVARQLREQGILRDEQITLVPNGIDVDRFRRAREEFVPADSLVVGSMGEFRPLKRHDDFIRAAAIVAAKFPEARFVLAGLDLQPLEPLVLELGLKERFSFIGWLNRPEEYLCGLDVFVSASETESFGLAMAEAMAVGTPVVATQTDGARELIEDQKTGALVPIGDVERMAQAIVELLAHPEKRREMGARAMEVVNEKFSLKRMVDQIEEIYATDVIRG